MHLRLAPIIRCGKAGYGPMLMVGLPHLEFRHLPDGPTERDLTALTDDQSGSAVRGLIHRRWLQ